MKIAVCYNSLYSAACSFFGAKNPFTREGWDFIERLEEELTLNEENALLEVNQDLAITYYEQELAELVDFDSLRNNINEEVIIDWLKINDYILGSYEAFNTNNEKTRYIMRYRDSNEPMISDFPEDWFPETEEEDED